MIPIMAVGFELGVEVTYPIDESYSTGLLMFAGQLFGIIYVSLMSLKHFLDRIQLSPDHQLPQKRLRHQRNYLHSFITNCAGPLIFHQGRFEKVRCRKTEENIKRKKQNEGLKIRGERVILI